ncbi:hypothetical protein MRQ47_004459 [Salmonella enterica]|nr:hypothetical protein [Salmonella enterica]
MKRSINGTVNGLALAFLLVAGTHTAGASSKAPQVKPVRLCSTHPNPDYCDNRPTYAERE